MIKRGVEHPFLFLSATFNLYAAKQPVPLATGIRLDSVESLVGSGCINRAAGGKHGACKFLFKILACIFDADKRHGYGYGYILTRSGVKTHPCADIVARHHTAIVGVNLIFSVILIPFGLYPGHGSLHLPESRRTRSSVNPHHEINGEHRLWVIAECAEKFRTLEFPFTYAAHTRPRFVGKPFAEVQQYVAFTSGRKGEPADTDTCRGCGFGTDAGIIKGHTVMPGGGFLVVISSAIFMVIHFERAGSGHQQQ